ncbi:MAG: S8 family serine peptidase [Bdellovibrionales bacterium]|nr:S8 family serine peptidase [Bdellovibrionales bacterium]
MTIFNWSSRALGLLILGGALPAHAVVNLKLSKAERAALTNRAPEARAGEFIVKFRAGRVRARAQVVNLLQSVGLQLKAVVNGTEGLYSARTLTKAVSAEVIARAEQLAEVEYVEPNFIYRALGAAEVTPSDKEFPKMWPMHNTGQVDAMGEKGKLGADISAPKAWALAKGSRDIVVAVIDTGIDYTHPDLKDNIWSDPEHPEIHGHNAIDGSDNSMDDNMHGSHCAGTIGASGDNALGVTGINWQVRLMGVKFLDSQGGGSLEDAIKAIDWAVDHGARVLSNSWGGGGVSQALQDAIARAGAKGVLFVAAAGNDHFDIDSKPVYPAAYKLDNLIAVAASNNRDLLADFSNYGVAGVHLMAPGDGILSTVPGGKYELLSGTSMACPHVAGASALLLSREPSLTPLQVRQRLMSSTDKFRALRRKIASAGRLNLFNLVANISVPGPEAVPENAWSAMVPQSVASPHPYVASTTSTWTIEHPGAKFLRVHFAKFETESGYDTVRVTSEQTGELVDSLTGKLADGFWTQEIEGSKAVIELSADDTYQSFGFEIDGYEFVN